MAPQQQNTFFAPQLYLPAGITDISFYNRAFNATERRRFNNEDGSLHVAELSIGDTLFHLHEEKPSEHRFHPGGDRGTTVMIGLFVPDVVMVVDRALEAGATLLSRVQDYDYGYRQGTIRDPFGHQWLLQEAI